MGTRENAALFGLLSCLPTAATLPLNSQDIGTSGWQLVDKATLSARVGEGGARCLLLGTLLPKANSAARPQLAKADFASSSHRLAWTLLRDYISGMCGRVIQSSGPLRYAIVDGMNVRDSRVHNYPSRWNAAPNRNSWSSAGNHRTSDRSAPHSISATSYR